MSLHFEPHPNHLVVRGLPAASVARGGPGSGFYGHAGRPGEKGGSAPGEGGGGKATDATKAGGPSGGHSGRWVGGARPGNGGSASSQGQSGKDRGLTHEQSDAVRLLATGTPLTREMVDVLEAMDNSGRLSSEEHDALDNARVYESGT